MLSCIKFNYGSRLIYSYLDQQIGQLYELMQAIRKQELEENDPEYKPEEK